MSRLHPYVRAALDEIKAHPADDTPRLMLADWLEENGTTKSERDRGTVLRLGCQAAARAGWDPRRFVEDAQARALLRRHRTAWLGDLPSERFTLKRGLFHVRLDRDGDRLPLDLAGATEVLPWLGGVEVSMRGPDLPSLPEARQALGKILIEARQLVLTDCQQSSPWIDLLDRVDTSQLTTLHIEGWLQPKEVQALLARPFASLQELVVPDPGGDSFPTWPFLRRLRVLRLANSPSRMKRTPPPGYWPALEDLAIENIATESFARDETWPRLRRLRVHRNGVGRLPSDLGRSLRDRLEVLELGHSPVRPTGLAALMRGNASHLRRLNLSALRWNADSFPMVFANAELPALRELHLANTELASAATAALAGSPLLDRLEALDLPRCKWNLAAAAQFGQVPALGRLRYLGLPGCPWSSEILAALARQGQPTRLESLDLQGTYGPANANQLQWLTPDRFPDLMALNLRDASIWNDDLRNLGGWPFLRQVRVLDLSENGFDTTLVRVLLDSPHLADAAWVRITDRGLAADLRAAWIDRFGPDSLVADEIPF